MQLNPAEISELIKSRIEGLGVAADNGFALGEQVHAEATAR